MEQITITLPSDLLHETMLALTDRENMLCKERSGDRVNGRQILIDIIDRQLLRVSRAYRAFEDAEKQQREARKGNIDV